jgi:hypothetical protein
MWYKEPRKDGLPDGDNCCARKAPRKPGIETSRTSYGLEASGNSTRPSGEEMDWKSQRKLHLLSYCKEASTGPCEGVDPLQNGKKETLSRGGAGKLEAPASRARVNEGRMDVKSECDTTLDHGIIRDEQSLGSGCNGRRIVAARVAEQKDVEKRPSKKKNGDAPLGYSERTVLRWEQCDVDGATLVKHPLRCDVTGETEVATQQ